MQPINTIAVILIFGLQLIVMGIDIDSKLCKKVGNIIMLIGWILNIIAIFMKVG